MRYIPVGLIMSAKTNKAAAEPGTRERLVDATVSLMTRQGFSATSVDAICAAAGTTKGGFFHHFPDKETAAKAALDRFFERISRATQEGDYKKSDEPLERIDGYLDAAARAAEAAVAEGAGCLVAGLTQELSVSHPAVRERCAALFKLWADWLEVDLRAAKERHAPKSDIDPKLLARHFLAVLEGAQILGRAGDTAAVRAHVDEFRKYLRLLFGKAYPRPRARR